MNRESVRSVRDLAEDRLGGLNRMKTYISDVGSNAATKINKNVRRNPWAYVGIAAVASSVIAFLIGRSRSGVQDE